MKPGVGFFSIARMLTGMVFAVSGFLKLVAAPDDFLRSVLSYRILSGTPAVVLARGLPWAELCLGVFLALGLWTDFALLTLWIFVTAFSIAVFLAMFRGISIEGCGCFGPKMSALPLSMTLTLDAALWFTFLLLCMRLSETHRFTLDRKF